MCNSGDAIVETGIEPGEMLPSGDCPAGRECYVLQGGCGPEMCMLPLGVHCSDLLSCNSGDAQIEDWDSDCTEYPNSCYIKQLCTQPSIVCRRGPDAGVNSSSSDGAVDAPATATGVDAQVLDAGYCGDGIVQTDLGEECDLGTQNGVPLLPGLGMCRYCQWVPYMP
jgi:hypothetical protein